MKSCRKAIIPVAGYGTRRLPITKSIEKCMLPLGNRPVVDYVVEDCVKAGIRDIYFVVSGPATQLRSYYARDMKLEDYLRRSGKHELADSLMPPADVTFHFIEQDLDDGRYGTTVPVWLARDYIDQDELVVVAVGDAAFRDEEGNSSLESMIRAGKPAILTIRVGDDVDLSKTGGVVSVHDDGSFRAIVEHADPAVEPSRLKNSAFYLLPGSVATIATEQIAQNRVAYNGEFFLTDVVNELGLSHKLKVVEASGEYLDAGSLASWVRANAWLLENL